MKKSKVQVPSLCETIVEQFVFEKSSIEELRMLERQLSKKIESEMNKWCADLERAARRNWPELKAMTILETYLCFDMRNDTSFYLSIRDESLCVTIFAGEKKWEDFTVSTFSILSKKLQKLDKEGQMMSDVVNFFLENHFLKSMRELVDK